MGRLAWRLLSDSPIRQLNTDIFNIIGLDPRESTVNQARDRLQHLGQHLHPDRLTDDTLRNNRESIGVNQAVIRNILRTHQTARHPQCVQNDSTRAWTPDVAPIT
jgi:hypothetical protein